MDVYRQRRYAGGRMILGYKDKRTEMFAGGAFVPEHV